MKPAGLVVVFCVFIALPAQGAVLFQDDFDADREGEPPTGWTEGYPQGQGAITQVVQNGAVRVTNPHRDRASLLLHTFEACSVVLFEYDVAVHDPSRWGGEIRLQENAGIPAISDWMLNWDEDHFKLILGGSNPDYVLDDFQYQANTWYHAKRFIDTGLGTGWFEIYDKSDPAIRAYRSLAPNISQASAVNLCTSLMWAADYSVDNVVVSAVPEPSTLLIWSLLGGVGIGVRWWRRRRTA